jgi:hypothetical protein
VFGEMSWICSIYGSGRRQTGMRKFGGRRSERLWPENGPKRPCSSRKKTKRDTNISESELCEVKIVRHRTQHVAISVFRFVTWTSVSNDSAQSTLCVVSGKQAISTDCNAHSTGDKIHVWNPQCRM